MDKTTLGSSAILGIRQATNLNATEYNWLGTIFYISYLIFEYPQNLALQRFPVGKWMRSVDTTLSIFNSPSALSIGIFLLRHYSINIFTWGVALCAHAACKNFAGLFVVRFIVCFYSCFITRMNGILIYSSVAWNV